MRLFNIKEFLIKINKLIDSEKSINMEKWEITNEQNKSDFLHTVLNFINQLILYVYLIYKVIWKNMPIGNLNIYLSAAGQFQIPSVLWYNLI